MTPPTDESSLDDRVRKWLTSQGYPLEMLVARAFRTKGFGVTQSEFYQDMTTNVHREIDVLAQMHEQVGNVGVACHVVIECKVSRDKPWILFTSDQPRPHSLLIFNRATSLGGFDLLLELAKQPVLYDSPIFQFKTRSAYGLTQAFTQNQDVAYAACLAVSQAARGLQARTDADRRVTLPFKTVSIAFQVVIIDARMFETYLDAADSLVVSEVPEGLLLWRNPVAGTGFTVIHLVTLSALDTFATDIAAACQLILRECKARPDAVLAAYETGGLYI